MLQSKNNISPKRLTSSAACCLEIICFRENVVDAVNLVTYYKAFCKFFSKFCNTNATVLE